MPWYKNHPSECPLCWVDCETGGLDTARAALLEVAVIVTDITGCEVRERWEAKVYPTSFDTMDPKALQVNGYDSQVWMRDAIPLDVAVREMVRLAQGGIFAGHNVQFDYPVVMRAFKRCGPADWPGPHWRVDTMSLAWPLLMSREVPDLKLTTLTAHLGIEHSKAHTAMADCEAARQVYCALMERWAKC